MFDRRVVRHADLAPVGGATEARKYDLTCRRNPGGLILVEWEGLLACSAREQTDPGPIEVRSQGLQATLAGQENPLRFDPGPQLAGEAIRIVSGYDPVPEVRQPVGVLTARYCKSGTRR
jgi:hypothetical protein